MRLEDAVNKLRQANVPLSYKQQNMLQDAINVRNGISQVWTCLSKDCRMFTYAAPLPILECYCGKGHVMQKSWDVKTSSLAPK